MELPPALRYMRPITFGLWLAVFAVHVYAAATSSAGFSWLVLLMTTLLFAGVHAQFWLEESEQGRKVREGFERMRGQIYEDDASQQPSLCVSTAPASKFLQVF